MDRELRKHSSITVAHYQRRSFPAERYSSVAIRPYTQETNVVSTYTSGRKAIQIAPGRRIRTPPLRYNSSTRSASIDIIPIAKGANIKLSQGTMDWLPIIAYYCRALYTDWHLERSYRRCIPLVELHAP